MFCNNEKFPEFNVSDENIFEISKKVFFAIGEGFENRFKNIQKQHQNNPQLPGSDLNLALRITEIFNYYTKRQIKYLNKILETTVSDEKEREELSTITTSDLYYLKSQLIKYILNHKDKDDEFIAYYINRSLKDNANHDNLTNADVETITIRIELKSHGASIFHIKNSEKYNNIIEEFIKHFEIDIYKEYQEVPFNKIRRRIAAVTSFFNDNQYNYLKELSQKKFSDDDEELIHDINKDIQKQVKTINKEFKSKFNKKNTANQNNLNTKTPKTNKTNQNELDIKTPTISKTNQVNITR